MRKEKESKRDIVLSIENLRFGYSGKGLIYDSFDLKLERGECVCIVGPSGCGKSTLLELVSGGLKPIEGRIEHGRIGWIFQDPYSSFHPHYTIAEQIEEVASEAMDDEHLQRLGLERAILSRYPSELSGGQLQRCSMLRALGMKPDLLLCDEPTSALDNITQLETMRLLVSLLERVGILLITHDMDLAKWMADRIVDIGKNAGERAA